MRISIRPRVLPLWLVNAITVFKIESYVTCSIDDDSSPFMSILYTYIGILQYTHGY